jgi:hypothetical protein
LTQRARAKEEADYHARTHILMPRPPADTRVLIPASIVLQRLHDEVATDHFTLGWLMHSLHKSSFGIIMLLLALVAIAPGASIVAGLLLMIPALQMIAGNPAPVFPRRIATRRGGVRGFRGKPQAADAPAHRVAERRRERTQECRGGNRCVDL